MTVERPTWFFSDSNPKGGMKVLVVTNLYPYPYAPDFGTFVRDEVESLRALGVSVDVFFFNGRASRWNYIKAYPAFWEVLRQGEYDLVHAHYALSGMIARAQLRLPVVVTIHGIEVVLPGVREISRLLARAADAVIVTSKRVQQDLRWEEVEIIPPGVDMNLFRPMPVLEARKKLGLEPSKRYVLFAGKPRPEKRFTIIRKAVGDLRNENPDVDLLVATGMPHAQVPLYMNAADVLVLASRYEGSPMVIKEAMACNLPIVVTDVGDAREVIAGTAGCYLTDGSVGDLAEKLGKAINFGGRTNGREKVSHLSLDAVARRVASVYEKVVSRGR